MAKWLPVLLAALIALVSLPVSAAEPSGGVDKGGTDKDGAEPVYAHAAVAADHPLASEVGVEILKQGGNVVDAAVATSFALSVLRPASCGLGGGGFMVIWNAKEQHAVAVDYRERAPQRSRRNMYADPNDPTKPAGDLSRKGHLAVAVPGTVAGLCYIQKQYGTMELQAVMQPAIRLAREGVLLGAHARKVQQGVLKSFAEKSEYAKRYKTLRRAYLNDGKPWREGDRFRSPQLAVLEEIAKKGKDGFYRGPVAEAILAEMQRGGGLITAADLAQTKPVVRRPVQGRFGDLDVIAMPPPSSGGTTLIETLNLLSAWEKANPDQTLDKLGHNSPRYLHLLSEAMKHAFADRAEFLGDGDFSTVPVARLIDPRYAAKLAARIDMRKTKPLQAYGRYLGVNDAGTSHYSIIDAEGNAVACTETINTTFGSFVVEPRYGIVMNNEMDDLAAVPGQPNVFGLMQSEANAVAPGCKPLSSMSPTIVLRDGKASLALGASGGPRIISSTLQVLLNVSRFNMSPTFAVRQPRIHHQWVPNSVFVEEPLYQQVQRALVERGHDVSKRNGLAVSQLVSRTAKGLRAMSDPRKHGRAAGY